MVRADDPAALNVRLVAAGVPVRELTALRRTLEQVVLELTGPSADRVDRSVGADRTSVWRRNGLGRVSDTPAVSIRMTDDSRVGSITEKANGQIDTLIYDGLGARVLTLYGSRGSAGSLLERLDTVKVIRCDEVQWRFLGLSLAGYNVLISLALAAIALWGARAAYHRPAES